MSVITKGLIGVEDLNIGNGTFNRTTSTGGTATLTKINLASLGIGAGSGIISSFVVISSTPVTATVGSIQLVNASGGNRVVNLPLAATALASSMIAIKKTDSSGNTVTIQAAGGDGIDDGTSLVLSLINETVKLVSDGANKWWVV